MTKIKMGVLYLMAHLVITLIIIGGYIFTLSLGHPDETLKVAIFTILGYWFGAVGIDKMKPSKEEKSVE
jgi:hypothetical protein